VEERLPHQHGPQCELPIARAGQVCRPLLADLFRTKAAVFETVRIEQLLRPWAKPAAQPAVDRRKKSHLLAIAKLRRQVSREHAAQNDLALRWNDLELDRQPPRKFHDVFAEKRRTRLEAHCHRRAIDLRQYSVGQLTE